MLLHHIFFVTLLLLLTLYFCHFRHFRHFTLVANRFCFCFFKLMNYLLYDLLYELLDVLKICFMNF